MITDVPGHVRLGCDTNRGLQRMRSGLGVWLNELARLLVRCWADQAACVSGRDIQRGEFRAVITGSGSNRS